MRRRILVGFAILGLLALTAAVALVVARLSAPPVQLAQPSGALAYTARLRGTWDIGIIEPDGTARLVTPDDTFHAIAVADALAGLGEAGVAPLELLDGLEADPTYSADGKQVAVMRRQEGEWRIVLMDVSEDGAPLRESARELTRGGDALFPVWRP